MTNVDASVGWNLRERALAAYLLVCYSHGWSVEFMMPLSVFTQMAGFLLECGRDASETVASARMCGLQNFLCPVVFLGGGLFVHLQKQ